MINNAAIFILLQEYSCQSQSTTSVQHQLVVLASLPSLLHLPWHDTWVLWGLCEWQTLHILVIAYCILSCSRWFSISTPSCCAVCGNVQISTCSSQSDRLKSISFLSVVSSMDYHVSVCLYLIINMQTLAHGTELSQSVCLWRDLLRDLPSAHHHSCSHLLCIWSAYLLTAKRCLFESDLTGEYTNGSFSASDAYPYIAVINTIAQGIMGLTQS